MSDAKEFFINLNYETSNRYDLAKFMQYSDNYDPLTSFFFLGVKNLKKQADYIVQKEEGRPDLVSFNYYGTTQYDHG